MMVHILMLIDQDMHHNGALCRRAYNMPYAIMRFAK